MTGTPIRDLPETTQNLVANLLAKETKKEAKGNQSWLTNVDDMKLLLIAMEEAHNRIVMTTGVFTLTPTRQDGQDGWWLKPEDGRFVPCGFFTPFKVNSLIAGAGFVR